MPFINTFNGAMRVLRSIEAGKCSGSCRSIWTRNFKYALKTKTNPLKLTPSQRKQMVSFMNKLKGKRISPRRSRSTRRSRSRSKVRKS